jgi:hypothetical protein
VQEHRPFLPRVIQRQLNSVDEHAERLRVGWANGSASAGAGSGGSGIADRQLQQGLGRLRRWWVM